MFDIHQLIKDVLDNFEVVIQEKHITVNLILEGKIQMVWGDPEKLLRVIQNLLDNAIKFQNGIITIETVEKQDKLWVYIKNNGEPIPKEDLSNIWDRFYKSDRSRGKDKKGMGIGLVIVKEIIKQHNEAMGVSSDENGSTFYFSTQK
ncbi:hypothetical protein AN639_01265 [Candidatus Epulonipiscium fishelsonii]|uniref:Uncharacterized protein n=1 Tax=Candidatus Epulonipiscium fishelsonii TaxID=77094 RepID=A0ACC8X7M5_9FIRM|nr:hypothetical protein AN396_11975 [Epulopiscium sp. SCG-B11WGA-EpuloA1]ONI40738.1 hypothetical protein AN639_01265 [Epulopiscium sp. SCG-B05WGA-EpuloA1]ONI47973.1 hypothetical protein AN644_03180 [Epulopiscium sp. SCG-C06WGA-EpuloA1]